MQPLPAKFVKDFRVAGIGWTRPECEQCLALRTAAQEMARDIKARAPGWTLTLTGQTSTGKTMLGKRLLRFARIVESITPARYESGREPPPGPSEIYWPDHDWTEVRDLKGATFLLIDDAARGRDTRQRLMDVLNFRVERRLFTVVTANLTFDEWEKLDAAIASRLRRAGGRVLQTGATIRPFESRH